MSYTHRSPKLFGSSSMIGILNDGFTLDSEAYSWQPAGTCWKCGGNIWYNSDEDNYSFAPNDPDCLCELKQCHFCQSVIDLELLTNVWQKTESGWQIEHNNIWLCEQCLAKNGYCEDCGDVMLGDPAVEYQCPVCEDLKRLRVAA